MQFPLNYPLTLSFKIIAVAPQISIIDANGNLVAYIKQKLFKLKEAVTVFEDEQQSRPVFNLKADRVIDFSARYHFTDQQGLTVGSVKRQGMRSLWKAQYDIYEGESVTMRIREENGWVKVLDSLFGELPIVGMFSGYLFHPAYLVSYLDERVVLRMEKQPAFFEGKFQIERRGELSVEDEKRAILSLIMMVLLERSRG
jgi:uncharacterized protein YxjI